MAEEKAQYPSYYAPWEKVFNKIVTPFEKFKSPAYRNRR